MMFPADSFAALVLFVSSQASALDSVLAGAECQATIRRQLESWDGRPGAAMVEPAFPTGLRSLRLPTGAPGIWLRVVEEKPHELFMERITATRVERLRFDEPCRAIESAVAIPPAAANAFTDSDLIVRVAREDRGVVLLWSPHMPLSVDQHAVLADVARELGLAVIALLDPGADADYAARVARERGVPAEATRPLGGIELAYRGMTTHTPSLQLFAGGRLIGPVLYGFRNAPVLRQTMEAVLAGREP